MSLFPVEPRSPLLTPDPHPDTLWAQVRADKPEVPRQPPMPPVPVPVQRAAYPDTSHAMGDQDMMTGFADAIDPTINGGRGVPGLTVTNSDATPANQEFPWEMIGLGLEESLPPADMVDEL